VKRTALAVVALVAVAAALMALAHANPLDGFSALARGALGGPHQLAETLVQTSALLFPSLAVAFAFRAGLFNIGAEGQLIVGGLVAGLLGSRLAAPAALAVPLVLAGGALGGAAWGAIAGALRSRFGSSEVIATLMLNILAGLLANYLVVGPLHSPGAEGPETAELPPSAWLPLLVPDTRLSIAIVLGIALAFALRFVFARTVFGYELRACGDGAGAARRAGIDVDRLAFVAMSLSGAIAGLGGATIVSGVLHRFTVELSPGYGFIAIAVALVGRLDPLAIVPSAFLFGCLQSGSTTMQALAGVPKDVIVAIEGLAILALSAGRIGTRATVART
jgi:simple sugar transport system permease protein